MANPHKSEVEFTVDKKVYTLHFSINAMCELEDVLGTSVITMAEEMSDISKLSIKSARTLFWAGLKDHHEAITQPEAGRLMTALGLSEAMSLVGRAFTLSFPTGDASRPLDSAGPLASTGTPH